MRDVGATGPLPMRHRRTAHGTRDVAAHVPRDGPPHGRRDVRHSTREARGCVRRRAVRTRGLLLARRVCVDRRVISLVISTRRPPAPISYDNADDSRGAGMLGDMNTLLCAFSQRDDASACLSPGSARAGTLGHVPHARDRVGAPARCNAHRLREGDLRDACARLRRDARRASWRRPRGCPAHAATRGPSRRGSSRNPAGRVRCRFATRRILDLRQ